MKVVREAEYTRVLAYDEPGQGNACHDYSIQDARMPHDPVVLSGIRFQNGPIQENGVNGVQNEDLIAICIDRLRGFQSGKFSCRENAIALTKLEEALMWLEKRTSDRKNRGVEGKNEL